MPGLDMLSEILLALPLRIDSPKLHVLDGPWQVSIPPTWRGLHLVLSGACWLQWPRHRLPLAAGAGDTLLTCDGRPHFIRSRPDASTVPIALDDLPHLPLDRPRPPDRKATRILSIRLTLDTVAPHPAIRTLPGPLVVSRNHIPAPAGLGATIDAIRAEIDRPSQGSAFVIGRLCEALAGHVFRVHQHEIDGRERGWLRALADPRLRPALARLGATPRTRASELARAALCSRGHFSRTFSALTGDSSRTLIRQGRIRQAIALLSAGDHPLPEIARQTGFHSVSALCRAFRRETGTTPGAIWRSLHRRPLPRLSDRGSDRSSRQPPASEPARSD